MKLEKNKDKLRQVVSESTLTQSELSELQEKLDYGLRRFGGIGLSSNQVGIKERVCLINVKEPILLVNPRIIEQSEESVVYLEQCLSIPRTMGKAVSTVRSKSVTVECDNLGMVTFSPDSDTWNTNDDFWNDEGMLECVVAQHEIDHLNGILITDPIRRYVKQHTNKKNYGRNDKVMVKLEDGSTEFMKYKHLFDGEGNLRSPYLEIL